MSTEKNGTFVKLYRKLLYDPIWTDYTPIHRDMWVVLLLRVDYATGELKTSTPALSRWVSHAERGKIVEPHRSTVMSVLRVFESLEMIELKTEKRGGVHIKIRNWREYQACAETRGGQQGNARDGQQPNNSECEEKTDTCDMSAVIVDNRRTTEVGYTQTTHDNKYKEVQSLKELKAESVPREEIPEGCSALARYIESGILSCMLGTQGAHLTRLQTFRERMSDDEIKEVLFQASGWILKKSRMDPWAGIFGVLQKRIDNPQERTDANGTSEPNGQSWPSRTGRGATQSERAYTYIPAPKPAATG